MKTKYIFALFIVLALVQIVVPAQMIWNRESIINNGKAFKFKTEPVDPSDPFKGKYIYLNYELNSFKTVDTTWERGEDIYVAITEDDLGYAQASRVGKEPPLNTMYVKGTVDWYVKSNSEVRFSFPFNEFYMEESKAYKAEVAHRNAQRDTMPNNSFALVYVKDGEAVLANVFLGNTPISKFVEP